MFNRANAIGWIGNVAVFNYMNGYMLIEWAGGKKLFIAN